MADDRSPAGAQDRTRELSSVLGLSAPASLRERLSSWLETTRRSYYDRCAAAERTVEVPPRCQRSGCTAPAEYALPADRVKSDFCFAHFPTPLTHDVLYDRLVPAAPDGDGRGERAE